MWAWVLLAYVIYRLIKALIQALGPSQEAAETSEETVGEEEAHTPIELEEGQEEKAGAYDLDQDLDLAPMTSDTTNEAIDDAVDRFHEDHEDFKAYLDDHARALLADQDQAAVDLPRINPKRDSDPKRRPSKQEIRQGLKWQVLLNPPPSRRKKK
ncbi:hypothetical protein ACX3VT_01100 [Aerococcus sanguinicola]|uniref:hypothetical protein n=1 Tax=unclassified Aerococcus TaxID=2618060 RepID=UPI0008A32529|nr:MULTISPECIES: hypothetical protein [unclassified Aerococcus]MDK6233313.1 hypothetical protein [Aerococcus sp. UMB10185]MDK6855141.1 hypothetical protein [Aerococcus sp. UMB7533]OFN04478.1 hypothetical protein HMPREF2626_00365 [Aerococcus sp. HMSC062A02]OHO42945.1 hypothetical protein HMPREF2705_02295 [Aerococcus sp. HMSC035B07]